MKTKFTQSDINRIKQAQKLIQELQKKQSLIYDTLLVNLPDLSKPEKSLLWDYVYNNQSMTISLGQDGLKLESIFRAENYPAFKPPKDSSKS